MINSMRDRIATLAIRPNKNSHTGLWLDRMLNKQVSKEEKLPKNTEHPYTTHIQTTCSILENSDYETFFTNRWLPALPQKNLRVAQAVGRLVVGLGSESAWENNITLHRTYGVPYIPGSALKGLAAAYAHKFLAEETWRKAHKVEQGEQMPIGDAHKIMFGDTTSEGYVTFFDALYLPNSGHLNEDTKKNQALWPDVITVHHPKYYSEEKEKPKEDKKEQKADILPPADWDDPTPISFVSATGQYLIALAGPEKWVETAFQILEKGLSELGVGAKTSSGYGRMNVFNESKSREILKQYRPKRLPKKGDEVTGQCKQVSIVSVKNSNIRARTVAINKHNLEFNLDDSVEIEFYTKEEMSGGFRGVVSFIEQNKKGGYVFFLRPSSKAT